MAHKIQIKRGNKADLPTLDAGEFGLCQDTNELFIGSNGNQKIFPPTAPTISDVEGLQTALDNKVDNSRVLTNVPANAKFTDTTYSEISTSEIDAGTASTLRTITGRRVKYILDKVQGWIGNLTKADVGLDSVDNVKQATKVEFDEHKNDNASHVPHLGTTTNSDNNYSIISANIINDGDKFSVKFNVAATGAATLKISSDGTARALKKPGGGDFKPKAGIYTLIRDGANFQLLGEGGEYGTATPADVLAGKTIGTEDGLKEGIIVDRGTVNHSLPINGSFTIPEGKHSGQGKVSQSVPTKGAQIYVPGTTDQAIAANQWLTGIQTIKGSANLIPSNLKKGVNLFDVIGTLEEGKKWATGVKSDFRLSEDNFVISGLSFVPEVAFFMHKAWPFQTVCVANKNNVYKVMPEGYEYNGILAFRDMYGEDKIVRFLATFSTNSVTFNFAYPVNEGGNRNYIWYAFGT